MAMRGILAVLGGGLLAANPEIPILGSPRELLANEILGIDDFRRAGEALKKGEFGRMLKSLGTGGLELGSTLVPGAQIARASKIGQLGRAATAAGDDVAQALTPRVMGRMRGPWRARNFEQYGGDIVKASPVGGRIISSIPGFVQNVDGVRSLTNRGRIGLGAIRGVEALPILDSVNQLSYMLGGSSVPIGTAAYMAQDVAAEQARRQALQEMLALQADERAFLEQLLRRGV
jgi:hypothetical protein